VVPTDDRYEDVRVTVVGLTQSPNPALRDAFLEMCRSQNVREVFVRHGYGASGKR
jgi:DNA-nicking Smr family endonuclease